MPTYDFEDVRTGDPVELSFTMSDAPRIGKIIQHEGHRLRRIISRPVKPYVERELEFKCWQVSGEEAAGAKNIDPADGCPVFSSKKEVRQFLKAKHEAGVTGATYGDGWDEIRP